MVLNYFQNDSKYDMPFDATGIFKMEEIIWRRVLFI